MIRLLQVWEVVDGQGKRSDTLDVDSEAGRLPVLACTLVRNVNLAVSFGAVGGFFGCGVDGQEDVRTVGV